MKKLPLGIQNFAKIIEGDYVYADKTQYIYNLINGASCYFLSRPRRFGKSLLLNTIGEVFAGNKELFRGLWIYESDYDYAKYPVVRIDMSDISTKNPDVLERSILKELKFRIKKEGFDTDDDVPSDTFKYLIRKLHEKYNQRVVVLIDEYDKPILDHIDNLETASENRKVLKNFYGILKSMDEHLRFTFFTGVSKFTKTSLFSELNNLLDITLINEYANICGITKDELSRYFGEHIESLQALDSCKKCDSLYDEILAWYDGYSWDGKTRVINPFSLLNFFFKKRFAAFWYVSGTPSFLLNIMKQQPSAYTNMKNLRVTEMMLDTVELDKIDPELILFQTGYLTIKEVILSGFEEASYILEMPNREVRKAFSLHVLSAFTESGNMHADRTQLEITDALHSGDLQKMLDLLRSLFASIPYQLHIDREAYYHSIFYAVMSVLGFDTDAEVSTSKGRIDAVLEMEDKVYVMEFKYKDCAPETNQAEKEKLFTAALNEGMVQIKERSYHTKYIGRGKTIYLAAFAFLGRDEIEMKMEIV
ncbi:MAG: ATP-binding protein [Oscillospiraceae bacterium]|nr:ATP-binding protein [Oscillospiraceae bacterium]